MGPAYNPEHPSFYRSILPETNRGKLANAIVVGDFYMWGIYGVSGPNDAAQLALHEVVLGALSKSRAKLLPYALEELTRELKPKPVVPTVKIVLNEHDPEGNPKLNPDGSQKSHPIDFPIPTIFARNNLTKGCSFDEETLLSKHSRPFPSFPNEDIGDFTRLVAYTMSQTHDYGKTQNWLSSEIAMRTALANGVLKFPELS